MKNNVSNKNMAKAEVGSYQNAFYAYMEFHCLNLFDDRFEVRQNFSNNYSSRPSGKNRHCCSVYPRETLRSEANFG